VDEGLVIAKNFSGCLESIFINDTNVIHTLKNPPYYENEKFYQNFTYHNCLVSES